MQREKKRKKNEKDWKLGKKEREKLKKLGFIKETTKLWKKMGKSLVRRGQFHQRFCSTFKPVDLHYFFWRTAYRVECNHFAPKYHNFGMPTGAIYAKQWLVKLHFVYEQLLLHCRDLLAWKLCVGTLEKSTQGG